MRASSRYGQAQAYYYGAQGDGSAWFVAEDGVAVRRYCETGEGDDELLTLGEPLPLERLRREEPGLAPYWDAAEEEQDAENEWKSAAFDLAPRIAAAHGVSPLTIGPDTLMRGVGVLALTPYATSRTLPAGTYRFRPRTSRRLLPAVQLTTMCRRRAAGSERPVHLRSGPGRERLASGSDGAFCMVSVS
ncbi:hypothetical protein ACWGR4_33565 [Embleya sp. NPDC055664]